MGITIRYLAPAAAGTAFAYSVERRKDHLFFDFDLKKYRAFDAILPHMAFAPLVSDGVALNAYFEHVTSGKEYIVRVHGDGPERRIVASLPVIASHDYEGGPSVEPRYSKGKKFIGGEVIEAKHRYTFYGDDGFTIHTATLWEDGTSSCNCTKWIRKTDVVRSCPHATKVLTLTANLDETGERPEPPPPPSPSMNNPFQRRSRSVDT